MLYSTETDAEAPRRTVHAMQCFKLTSGDKARQVETDLILEQFVVHTASSFFFGFWF